MNQNNNEIKMTEIDRLYRDNFYSDFDNIIEEKLNLFADLVIKSSSKLLSAIELGLIKYFIASKTEESKYRLTFILKECTIISPMLIELLDDSILIVSPSYDYEAGEMNEPSIHKAIEVYSITQKAVLKYKRIAEQTTAMTIRILPNAMSEKVIELINEILKELISSKQIK